MQDITKAILPDPRSVNSNVLSLMQAAIEQIINRIPPGHFFDSHYVISEIFQHASDAYIRFAGPEENIAQMHGRIAEIISRFPHLCRRVLDHQSWSLNIHHKANQCALWERM
jgi:hypothetical protein